MAINSLKEYAHLTDADIEAIGAEFDAIRKDIEADLGKNDARYIHNAIRVHRGLEIAGRLLLLKPKFKPFFWLGAVSLGTAKIIENMELGHNIMHGQWDWMHDPEIHSSTWEWDNANFAQHWQYTHNFVHHKYTNIVDVDDDIGYGVIRVTRDQPWRLFHIFNFINNIVLGALFQYGVAIQHLNIIETVDGLTDRQEIKKRFKQVVGKFSRQVVKDYIAFPVLAGKSYKQTMKANAIANLIRNVWTYAVIFCGHFPDGAEKFTMEDYLSEPRSHWYLRQMLGSANFRGGFLIHFLSGNLSHQIEHHLFPDLPSNRYAQIAQRVRVICEKYDLPYTTGSFLGQYFKTQRTILKLSLPSRFLKKTTDNAPETSSELRFYTKDHKPPQPVILGKHNGLRAALEKQKNSTFDKLLQRVSA